MSLRTSLRRRPVRFAAGGASLLLLVGLTACSPVAAEEGSGELRSVDFVLDWTPNTNHSGIYLAKEKGYFEDAGLDVNIIEPGDTSGTDLVAVGQADFAISVSESLIPARQAGVDVVSIATIIQHNTSSLISLTDTGIQRPRDLEGKTYGGYEGALEEALIRTLVEEDGGDPDKVNFAPLSTYDFRIGLTEKQYDTAWVFDAWDTILLRDVQGLDVSTLPFIDYTDYIPDWYTPIIVTSAQTIKDDPELVKAFLGAVSHGYQDAIADPKAAADALLAAAPELDADLVQKSAVWLGSRYTDTPDAWGVQDGKIWDDFVAFLEKNDIIKPGFDTDAAWTNDFLPADD